MVNRSFVTWMVLAFWAAAAHAAKPPQVGDQQLKKVTFPGGYCDLYLLAQEMVQNDLDLAPDQVSTIRKLVAQLVEEQRTLPFAAHVQRLTKDEQVALGLLKREQVQRLKQISLQCRATASFWDPSVRQALRISDDQFRKIQDAAYPMEAADEEVGKLALVREKFFAYPKRVDKEWQHREWERIAALTPMQQTKWKEMLGTPFTGTFPSDVLVPSTVPPKLLGEVSIEALRTEVTALRQRLVEIEKRLAEIENGKQKK